MCDAALQFSGRTRTFLYHMKNNPAAAMSEDGSQTKITLLLAGGRKRDVMEMLSVSRG